MDREVKTLLFQDVLDVVEEEYKSESESSSEYEEYTDSEDETGPRLKPVFVPKADRLSIKEKEALAKQEELLAQEKKRQSELRKRESHRVSREDGREGGRESDNYVCVVGSSSCRPGENSRTGC